MKPATPTNKTAQRSDAIAAGLGRSLIEAVGTQATSRHYSKKQSLFYEDSPLAGIYVVQSGIVKISKMSADGKQHILRIATAGDVIALEDLLVGDSHKTTGEMIEEGTIWHIGRAAGLEAFRRNPQLGLDAMKRLASVVTSGDEERLDLARSSVRERMARLLATLSADHGVSDKKGVRINLRLSREEMAEMIGTASETAMRLLKEFREDALVDVCGRDIMILDRDRLLQTANLAA